MGKASGDALKHPRDVVVRIKTDPAKDNTTKRIEARVYTEEELLTYNDLAEAVVKDFELASLKDENGMPNGFKAVSQNRYAALVVLDDPQSKVAGIMWHGETLFKYAEYEVVSLTMSSRRTW